NGDKLNTPKKILILGNSNSILKDGWLTSFKEKSNIECLNLSIGGSPSPALILQVLLNENKLDNIELAIIEPCVIDHGEEWQDPIAIKKYALLLFSLLASKDIKSFLLVLPRNFKALS